MDDCATTAAEKEQSSGKSCSEGSAAEAAEACVVCYAAPPAVLLLVCGHAVLCAACYAALAARAEPSCPVCRAKLCALTVDLTANSVSAARFAPCAGATCLPPQPRLAVLLHLLYVNMASSDDSDDSDDDERDDIVAVALVTLCAFASHALEQRHAALEGGAMEAACAAMRAAPLRPRVRGVGCALLVHLTHGAVEPALCVAVARAAPRAVALHALRCLALSGCDSRTPGAALQAVANLLHPAFLRDTPRGWGRRDAAALARLARNVCLAAAADYRNDEDEEEEEEEDAQTLKEAALALGLLPRLLSAVPEGAHVEVVSPAAAALARMLRARSKFLAGCAASALHDAIVNNPHAPHLRSACDAGARAALCAALLREDALQALLACAERFSSCDCEACTSLLLHKLLPTLSALSGSSLAALRAAMRAGLMPFLEDISVDYYGRPTAARTEVCACCSRTCWSPQL
jgi:hypothetical protein